MRDICFLGIDTSNYTTSIGLVDGCGDILANIKRPLPVAEGARGLRQSDALFAHTKNLPDAMNELKEMLGERKIVAVGCSSRPRNVVGSYMPCFLAGEATAHTASAVLQVPLYTFSHQCGHMMAAIRSSGRYDLLEGRPFCAFHVSGGTTEALCVRAVENGFQAEIVGGTKDLAAGQVIDRVGVALGLSFPCGPQLEQLALQNKKKLPHRKIPLQNGYVNFSGLENLALLLYRETQDAPYTAAFVLSYLAEALFLMAGECRTAHGNVPLLFAGGVMCNSIIKERLSSLPDIAFAEPFLSADNAVGVACLTARCFLAERN
ncbi:MAG: peptidase M22 [Clostridia bacterium]|nr:peptidase M22 [Clostridia bacterium]